MNNEPFPAGWASMTFSDWCQMGRSVPNVWDALPDEQRDGYDPDELDRPGVVWADGIGGDVCSWVVNMGTEWVGHMWGGHTTRGNYAEVAIAVFNSRRDMIDKDG